MERQHHNPHSRGESASEGPRPPTGEIPDRYTVIEPISRGGMAIVYKVIDTDEGKTRALKLLPLIGCGPTTIELFRLEFSRISSLEHPNIVKVYDFGSAGGEALYFVMEYLDALHFDEGLKGSSLVAIQRLCIDICDALSYIHSRGIVHGDLKPSNVLVVRKGTLGEPSCNPPPTSEGRDLTAKLTDFGLSRMMSEAGIAGGTYAYAAPEVVRGLSVDARADLYSFGVMLYELATGTRLFVESSRDAMLRAHVLKIPVSPREIDPSIPQYLQSIILKLLEKDPGLRYQSARELASVLAQESGLEPGIDVLTSQPVSLLRPQLVGRDSEVSVLKESLISCREEGKGAFFLITGEAGIGKTRLLEHLRLYSSMENLRVASLQSAESFGFSTGGHLRWSGRSIGTVPCQSCDISDRDEAQFDRDVTASEREQTQSEREETRPDREGAPDAHGEKLRRIPADSSGTDILFRSIFPQSVDKLEPTVVLIDDIHLGGIELLESLKANVRLASVLPLVLIAACEPGALEKGSIDEEVYLELKDLTGVRELALRRFSQEEVLLFASSVLAIAPSDETAPLARWLFAHSQGIPLLIQELLDQLVKQRRLMRLGHNVTWDISGELPPATTVGARQLSERRLQALKAEESELVAACSVMGSTFSLDAIGFVLSKTPAQVAQVVDALREKGIVTPGESGLYMFSHPATRLLIYKKVDPEIRRKLHGRMVLWLEDARPGIVSPELAAHLEESGQTEKAQECWTKCVELFAGKGRHLEAMQQGKNAIALARALGIKHVIARALRLTAESADAAGRHADALVLWEELLGLTSEENRDEFRTIVLEIARDDLRFSRYQEAEKRLLEAMRLVPATGAERDKAEILADLGWAYFGTSRNEEAITSLAKAAKLASGRGVEVVLARIYNRSGVVLSKMGRLDESEERHREAVRLARVSGQDDVLATCLNNLGLLLIKKGLSEEAEVVISEACKLAKKTGELMILSSCYNNLGIARKDLLKLDSALDSHLISLDLHKKCGDLVGAGKTAGNVAVVYRLKGELGLARRFYEESYRIAEQFSRRHDRAMAAANLGEIHCLTGNFDEAEKLYTEALRFREESNDADGISFCAAGLGNIYLRKGDSDGALQWAEKAVRVSSAGSQERAAAELLLIEILCSLGKIGEAREELERLSAGEGGEVPSVELGIRRRMEGLVLEKSGNLKDAIDKFRSSCSILGQEADSLERARSLLSLGDAILAYLREGASQESPSAREKLLDESISVLEEAHRIFERLEASPERTLTMTALLKAYRETSSAPGIGFQREEADTLLRAAELVNSSLPSALVLEKIMDLALDKTGAERGLIVLTDKDTGEIEKVLSRSMEDQTEIDALEISRTVVKRVTKGGESLSASDATKDPELKDVKSVARFEIRSILCVPLRARNKVIGAVYLDNRSVPGAFGPGHQSFMEGFANLAGMAIETSMLREELERVNEYLNRENTELRKQVAPNYRFDQLVGESPQMKKVFSTIAKVACSSATVLIVGASGTGKELVARAIHFNSPRKDKPFIPLNCAAIPRELIEGELFGIEDRVATGVSKRIGIFEQADGGSIFLDEIGDMSLDLQARLLRVLQEREFVRVGGRRSIKVDVRIICATNKNLLAEMSRGSFRSDLYYRISGIPVEIPLLKERKGDIPFLVDFFLKKYSEFYKTSRPPRISREIMELLIESDWEGNVRELENCIERFVVMCAPGEEVPFALLPQDLKVKALSRGALPASGKPGKTRLKEEIQLVEKQMLIEALIRNGGNRSKAARELGISEQSVRYKIRKYRINVRHLCREA